MKGTLTIFLLGGVHVCGFFILFSCFKTNPSADAKHIFKKTWNDLNFKDDTYIWLQVRF